MQDNKKAGLSINFVFFLVYSVCYCLYPVWYLPVMPSLARCALFNVFLVISLLLLFNKGFAGRILYLPKINIGSIRILLPVVFLAAALHLPFWFLPVPTGEDFQSFVSPPAYLLHKISDGFGTGFLRVLLWVALAGAAYYLFKRAKNGSCVFKIYPEKYLARVIISAALLVAGNLYFWKVNASGIVNKIGSWETIFRFPPVSKILYFAGYSLFGINEGVANIIQFLFLVFAGVYLIKILEYCSGKTPQRAVMLSLLVFPTFFHFSNFPVLACGLIFFYFACSYYFLKAISEQDSDALYIWVFFIIIGALYRRLMVGFLGVSILYNIYLFAQPGTRQFARKLAAANLLVMLFAVPFPLIGIVSGIRGTATLFPYFQGIYDIFNNMRLTLGWGICAIAAGLAYISFNAKFKKTNILFLAIFAVYFAVFSQTSAAGWVRHMQPLYAVIFYFRAAGLTRLHSGSRKTLFISIFGVLVILSVYQDIFNRQSFQRTNYYTRYEGIVPYDMLCRYLGTMTIKDIRVYAPMEGEPNNFYIAKYGLSNVSWNRDREALLKMKNSGELYDYLKNNGLWLFFVPEHKLLDNIPALEGIENGGVLALIKEFDYHGNKGKLYLIDLNLTQKIVNPPM